MTAQVLAEKPTTDRAATGPQRSGAVCGAVAAAILAVAPFVMELATRSLPALLAAAAVMGLIGAALGGGLASAGHKLAAALRTPMGRVGAIFTAFAVASLVWSASTKATGFALGEALVPAVAALVLAVLPRAAERWIVPLFAVSFALACLLVIVELETGIAWRSMAGLRAIAFIFNRPVITLLLLYAPLALLLVAEGRRWIGAALGILLVVTVLRAHSGAAMFGLGFALPVLAVALLAPRVASALLLAWLLGWLAIAPVKGDVAAQFIPDKALDALESVHARDRVQIWQSFGEVVWRRPLIGTGFGTSPAMARTPVAAEVRAERRVLLDVGHPHDIFLQIWTELGLVGALLAALFFCLLIRGIAALPRLEAAGALATVAAASAIALVGHGAWQGWWVGLLGLSALWFGVPRPYMSLAETNKDVRP